MFPGIGVLALYLLLRGHNLPGGGFVAGLTMAVAFILQYMAGGTRWVEERWTFSPVRLMGVGLFWQCGAGLGAWLFGHPFLTSHTFAHFDLPLIGNFTLPTAFIFDIGVFSGGRSHRAVPHRARAPVVARASRGAERP